jgi:hypothetical protein
MIWADAPGRDMKAQLSAGAVTWVPVCTDKVTLPSHTQYGLLMPWSGSDSFNEQGRVDVDVVAVGVPELGAAVIVAILVA